MKTQQRGGTVLGIILGIIFGLGAALGVAVYVSKVPMPFLSKAKNADQDAAEARKNKDWDPNSPLYGKNPARITVPAAPEVAAPAADGVAAAPAPDAAPATTAASQPVAPVTLPPKPEPKTSTAGKSSDPLGDLVKAKSAEASAAESFNYFVQAGAFRSPSDAEAQRAKLAMLGWESRVSEREQNGRTVFRVRVGPFGKRDDAEQLKTRLEGAGVDSALVRVQR
ncbi:SPOR domain-containing protein [Comamonas endophytica]|uniref:SPOR domain-containing protein n=1 Tax=Comamonas endophytica TaxID=2949090 RepID=A0ABY6G5P0_9BURK|nr:MULTISPECIES: SPOR domain-containing protein [unclassified Acidovorax]MCD2510907.1 SPOR domain-containing protein [Acidovorax sp. D4N7]UYG50319.1 SPOR domain-containing protein [Acidovorax sp. 5MLIR]